MKKKVTIIHTGFVSVNHLKDLFSEILPEVHLNNIVDDSLLEEVLANGGVTPNVIRKICKYYAEGERLGSDLIFNQCSSVGEAADVAAQTVKTPVLKVDLAMAEKAVATGPRIGVVATLETTFGPTKRLIQKVASEKGKDIEIISGLCGGAFDLLMSGKRQDHDQMVIDKIRELEAKVDVIALAQGSMALLVPKVSDCSVPVLASPRLGVEKAREVLTD